MHNGFELPEDKFAILTVQQTHKTRTAKSKISNAERLGELPTS